MKLKKALITIMIITAYIFVFSVGSYADVSTERVFENNVAKLKISASDLPLGQAAVFALNGGTDISSAGLYETVKNTDVIQFASRNLANVNGNVKFDAFAQRIGGTDTVDIYVNGIGQDVSDIQQKTGVYIKDALIVTENQKFEYEDKYILFSEISNEEKAKFFAEKDFLAKVQKIGENSPCDFAAESDKFQFEKAANPNEYTVKYVFDDDIDGDGIKENLGTVQAENPVIVTQSNLADVTAIKLSEDVTSDDRALTYYVDEFSENDIDAQIAEKIIKEKLGDKYKVWATEDADGNFTSGIVDIKNYVTYAVSKTSDNKYEVELQYTNPVRGNVLSAVDTFTITVSLMPYSLTDAEFIGVTTVGKTKENKKYTFTNTAKVRGKITPLENGVTEEFVEYDIIIGDVEATKGAYISQADIDAVKTSIVGKYYLTVTISDPRATNVDNKFVKTGLYIEVVNAHPVKPIKVSANPSAVIEVIYGTTAEKIKEAIVSANAVDKLGDLFYTVYTDDVARDIDAESIEYNINKSDIRIGDVGMTLGEHEAIISKVTAVSDNKEITPQDKKIKIKVILEDLDNSDDERPSGGGVGSGSSGGGKKGNSTIGKPVENKPVESKPIIGGDIPKGHYAEQAVRYLIDRGIINGDQNGNVNLNENLSRAQVAKIVTVIANGIELPKNTALNVKDANNVPDWAKPYISYCLENEILSGYPDGTFGAKDNVSRSQLATILARLFKLESGNSENLAKYTDIDSNHWAIPSLSKCVELGIMNGYGDNTMRPDNYVTTAEACTMIYRTMLLNN